MVIHFAFASNIEEGKKKTLKKNSEHSLESFIVKLLVSEGRFESTHLVKVLSKLPSPHVDPGHVSAAKQMSAHWTRARVDSCKQIQTQGHKAMTENIRHNVHRVPFCEFLKKIAPCRLSCKD